MARNGYELQVILQDQNYSSAQLLSNLNAKIVLLCENHIRRSKLSSIL